MQELLSIQSIHTAKINCQSIFLHLDDSDDQNFSLLQLVKYFSVTYLKSFLLTDKLLSSTFTTVPNHISAIITEANPTLLFLNEKISVCLFIFSPCFLSFNTQHTVPTLIIENQSHIVLCFVCFLSNLPMLIPKNMPQNKAGLKPSTTSLISSSHSQNKKYQLHHIADISNNYFALLTQAS